ncbi:MAG: hypothetical protein HYR94_13665 [Chloroflexi bacterium]|nr:hypothetical protein [Chloroflexota bacterium]
MQLNVEGYVGYVVLPYALLRSIPVLDWNGVLGRLNVATMLCVAVMAAYGTVYVLSKVKMAWQPAIIALLSLLILFEFLTIFPFPAEPDTVPAFYFQLSQETSPQRIIDLPLFGDPSYNNYSMHYQTVHQQPIAGGHFMRKPAGASELTGFINQLLSPPFDQPALAWPDPTARLGLLNKFGFTKVVARLWLMTDEKSAAQLAYLASWLGPSRSIAQEQTPAPPLSNVDDRKKGLGGEVAVFDVPPGGTPLQITPLLTGEGWQFVDNSIQLQAPADLFVYVDSDQAQPAGLQLSLSAPEPDRYLAIDHNGRPAMRLYLTREILNYNLPLALSPGAHQFTVSYNLSSATVAPGQPLLIYLYWQGQSRMDQDYSAFVHLVTPTGQLIGQADYLLGGWLYPTSTWPAGYLATAPSLFFVPPDTAPAEYQLRVGVYRAETGERLLIKTDTGEQNSLLLSTLTVTP